MNKLAVACCRIHSLHTVFIRPSQYMNKLFVASCIIHGLCAVFTRPSQYSIKLAVTSCRIHSLHAHIQLVTSDLHFMSACHISYVACKENRWSHLQLPSLILQTSVEDSGMAGQWVQLPVPPSQLDAHTYRYTHTYTHTHTHIHTQTHQGSHATWKTLKTHTHIHTQTHLRVTRKINIHKPFSQSACV